MAFCLKIKVLSSVPTPHKSRISCRRLTTWKSLLEILNCGSTWQPDDVQYQLVCKPASQSQTCTSQHRTLSDSAQCRPYTDWLNILLRGVLEVLELMKDQPIGVLIIKRLQRRIEYSSQPAWRFWLWNVPDDWLGPPQWRDRWVYRKPRETEQL